MSESKSEIEITPEMIEDGVAALSFWLDGLEVAVGELTQSQVAVAVYSATAEASDKLA